MNKWEYLKVLIKHKEFPFQGVSQVLENGKPSLKNIGEEDLYNYLNQLGENGWELVNVFWSEFAERYYFKRSID